MNVKLSEACIEYCDENNIIFQWAGNIGYGELTLWKHARTLVTSVMR